MATDGPDPPPCNPKIFEKGKTVVSLDAASNAAEHWVKAVANKANAQVDWHYSGGIANVLHLGDKKSRTRVIAAIRELAPTLKGEIVRIYDEGGSGLPRRGVTPMPEGTIGAFVDTDGKPKFLVKKDSKK